MDTFLTSDASDDFTFSRFLKEKINLNKIAKADNEMLERWRVEPERRPKQLAHEMHKNLFVTHIHQHTHTYEYVYMQICKLLTHLQISFELKWKKWERVDCLQRPCCLLAVCHACPATTSSTYCLRYKVSFLCKFFSANIFFSHKFNKAAQWLSSCKVCCCR